MPGLLGRTATYRGQQVEIITEAAWSVGEGGVGGDFVVGVRLQRTSTSFATEAPLRMLVIEDAPAPPAEVAVAKGAVTAPTAASTAPLRERMNGRKVTVTVPEYSNKHLGVFREKEEYEGTIVEWEYTREVLREGSRAARPAQALIRRTSDGASRHCFHGCIHLHEEL